MPRGWLDSIAEGDVVTPYIRAAIENIESLDGFNVDLTHESDDYFHPSSHTYDEDDTRLLYFRMNPETHKRLAPQKFSYAQRMSLLMGTNAHTTIQSALVHMGIVPEEDIEVPILDEEWKIKGHCDFIFTRHDGERAPVEFKTSAPSVFSGLKDKPLAYWTRQFNFYLDVLGYDYGYIVAMEASSPWRLKEFRHEKDQEYLDDMYAKLSVVHEHMKLGTPPPNVCYKKGKPCTLGSSMMNNCPAKDICLETWR